VEEDAGFGVGAEFVAESMSEIAMVEWDEFGESDVELRKLFEQVGCALLEVGEEGGGVVGEIVYAEEMFGFFVVWGELCGGYGPGAVFWKRKELASPG
jgi:hypothetical protein